DSAVGVALSLAITHATDFTFREVINEAIRRRDEVSDWIKEAGGIDAAMTELSGALGVDQTATSKSIAAEFSSGALIAAHEWPEITGALAAGSKHDRELAHRIRDAAAAGETTRIGSYLQIF